MSTSNKLIYLNGTKQLLKDKINNLGGSIDDNTTFREYANQLQNIYDNLPKTEYGEGTEINLGKTIKGKLDYENGVVGIGQTEQDGTPTPSTPITINSVTGNQNVVVKDGNNNIIATHQLSLGDIELNAIGNYKDELIYDVDEDKVYKNSYIKEIGKDDVLQRLSSGYYEFTDVVRSVINLGDLPSSISSANGLCSHLVFLADFIRNIEHFYVQGTQIFFFIKKSRLSEISITGIYNYLATLTDLKFCYVMNTPIETEITDTNLHNQVKMLYNAHSLNGTTIITSNGNLPMIIKCRALKGA